MVEPLAIARASDPIYLLPQMANRHGLVAGATGTGKTVTLQVMAEAFSRIGVPVFAADIKGDLSGISHPGKDNPKITERAKALKLSQFSCEACPVTFWDVFGEQQMSGLAYFTVPSNWRRVAHIVADDRPRVCLQDPSVVSSVLLEWPFSLERNQTDSHAPPANHTNLDTCLLQARPAKFHQREYGLPYLQYRYCILDPLRTSIQLA